MFICMVVLCSMGVAGSIRLEGLQGCTVLLGPSQTSVYIEGCSNSVFSVACHQLRIHKTTESRVYTRCRTHPIIEDCSALGFGPYALRYPNLDSHFAVSAKWLLFFKVVYSALILICSE